MSPDLLYQVALTMVPNIGAVQAKTLVDHFGEAEKIFKSKKKQLATIEGIGEGRAQAIKDFGDFETAEEELAFIDKHHIRPLFLTDPDYPQRLLHCYDPPTLLYYRGNANLNASKVVSIIGTRSHTEYGRQVTESIIEGLKEYQALIVSGLAFGVDALAHRFAVTAGLPTVAVVAHGLDTIYPPEHRGLAKDILLNGGLITEFRRKTKPDKHNFPKRNRIVAGMADATIVIETAVKGGSMITAELAYSYNRDVFAVPGKLSDARSAGCLQLVRQNKAMVYTGVEDLLQSMGWLKKADAPKKVTLELFIEFSDDEKVIVDLLKQKESIHIDEIYLRSSLSSSSVAEAMLNLELQNVISSLPGKMYKLN